MYLSPGCNGAYVSFEFGQEMEVKSAIENEDLVRNCGAVVHWGHHVWYYRKGPRGKPR